MKAKDFKLLADLPDDYDYKVFDVHNRPMILGKKNEDELIGFYIVEDKLVPIDFLIGK